MMALGTMGGVITDTAMACDAEEPQALFATTEMLPLELPAVAVIELVVELPDQPNGKVQV